MGLGQADPFGDPRNVFELKQHRISNKRESVMQLPEPILAAVMQYFDAHHPFWHLARVQESEMKSPREKATWKKARKMFPTLRFRDEPGAGEDFLTFHREMMREYKWILERFPEAGLSYLPWQSIPDDVRQVIETEFGLPVDPGLSSISTLVNSGTLSNIGGFIEPCPAQRFTEGRGLHDLSHGAVAEIEEKQGLASDFSMGSPSTAHRNVVFYQLHGWIDECYAAWQRAHGQIPDLSPKAPSGMHRTQTVTKAMDRESLQDAVSVVDRVLRFDRRWLGGRKDL